MPFSGPEDAVVLKLGMVLGREGGVPFSGVSLLG